MEVLAVNNVSLDQDQGQDQVSTLDIFKMLRSSRRAGNVEILSNLLKMLRKS
jgi:hypothetical protein